MKWSYSQDDFSSGELAPRAQGHFSSEAYKAGVKRAANVMPTRAGSMASRAGGRHISDGYGGVGVNQGLVQHIPVQDGPLADFIVEIGPTYVRLMDKFGVIPWLDIAQQFMKYTYQTPDAWADVDGRVIHMRHNGGGQAAYSLVAAVGGGNPNAYPAGTNETWVLSGKIAGSDIQVVVNPTGAALQNFTISPSADGSFSVVFTPTFGGVAVSFAIDLYTLNDGGNNAATLWNLHLVKNGNPVAVAHGLTNPAGVDRIRAAACWTNMGLQGVRPPEILNYWVVFAGGKSGVWGGYSLRWQPPAAGLPSKWTFQALPQASPAVTLSGCNTVAVYQDRILYGRNVNGGRAQIIASKIGFVDLFDDRIFPGGVAGVYEPLFVFKVASYVYVVAGVTAAEHEEWNIVTAGGAVDAIAFGIPTLNPPYPAQAVVVGTPVAAAALAVRWNGVPVTVLPGPRNGADPPPAIGKCIAETPIFTSAFFTQSAVGGTAYFKHGMLAAGDVLEFTTIPLATDPLSLSPSVPAKIAWLNVLRGLMMGTSQSEKLFTQGEALTIDPATGQAFSLNDESNLGADERIVAINVNDKVLFVQRGRRILRLANISISNNGGLVAEDVGILGEHLTGPRVRAMCMLKSPVQRLVFGMDDGSGAVMTLGGKSGVAWSRFTIPPAFGGIYNVAALHGSLGSELWVGTDNGVTLQWDSFESDIQVPLLSVVTAFPTALARVPYDNANPLPPTMDGWVRCGLASAGGVQWITGLSKACVGWNVYALINGQVRGPYVAIADPSGDGAKVVLTALGLTPTWVDSGGLRQPQEVYAGLAYPEHRMTTLPLEGGSPTGSSQSLKSRKTQLYVRFVDSYLPLINGERPAERLPEDPMDVVAGRVTGDRLARELGFNRGDVIDVVQDAPLRFEISAMFGGTQTNNL